MDFTEMKKVSIIVRTCNRPEVLKNCLRSIQDQTYENIEVVVVEDGEPNAYDMIKRDFSHMDIHYYATGNRVGRSKAGNIALSKATGDYLNFLDDDDEFYPDHVASLIKAIDQSGCKAAYAVAEESVCYFNRKKQAYFEVRKFVRYRNAFNRLYLLHENYFPIQTVMFSKELFEKYGGFKEDLTYLEDWELWVRYAMKADFCMVNTVTSKYRVPIKAANRSKQLRSAYARVYEYFLEGEINYNIADLHSELNALLREHYRPLWKRIAIKILKPFRKG